ncbi:hypothetical protein HYFRA_00002629 [Hymenoscyphus fraxineus]|uniref:Uncharacterized protein n=1 Tax=Hymenoscyphus fraxineus TaxID=746836 RepID=A0A9N9Q0U1_9HELO|nr:hypothetical protein HYFRA_00002629 [Hymenoscyphus fraxineus]
MRLRLVSSLSCTFSLQQAVYGGVPPQLRLSASWLFTKSTFETKHRQPLSPPVVSPEPEAVRYEHATHCTTTAAEDSGEPLSMPAVAGAGKIFTRSSTLSGEMRLELGKTIRAPYYPKFVIKHQNIISAEIRIQMFQFGTEAKEHHCHSQSCWRKEGG